MFEMAISFHLDFFAKDPDGSTLSTERFVAYINGEVNPSVIIQGSGPFYQILWAPPDRGDYTFS